MYDRKNPQAVCEKCGEPCVPVLATITHDLPDTNRAGMHAETFLGWVSDCCHRDYTYPDDPYGYRD